MNEVFLFLLAIILSAIVALAGKNRRIGYGWSFILCLFLSPLIGLVIILFSRKKDVDFVDIDKN